MSHMGRMRMNVGALGLQVARAWRESPGKGLRPLASVIRGRENEKKPRLRDLAVGQALVFEWPEEDVEAAGPAWLTCPVCGVTVEETTLQRVGPGCSLCPSCGKVLPL